MDKYEGLSLTEDFADWDWDKIEGGVCCYRLLDDDPSCGFDFKILHWFCGVWDEDLGDYADRYEIIYHGRAYFDGARHLYMGSEEADNYGYDYYPDLDFHIESLKWLKKLCERMGCDK